MANPIYHSQYTAAQIEGSIGKSPRINDTSKEWEVWDIGTGAYVTTGIVAESAEYAEIAETAKSTAVQFAGYAQNYAGEALTGAENAEAWTAGTRNGDPVESDDPAYHNNAKYYAEQAEEQAKQYGAYVCQSASGAPAVIDDGADGVPVKIANADLDYVAGGYGNIKLTREAETLVFNQQVQNGNFADGTSGWSGPPPLESGPINTISASNGVLTATLAFMPDQIQWYQFRSVSDTTRVRAGHKYFFSMEWMASTPCRGTASFSANPIMSLKNIPTSDFEIVSTIFEATPAHQEGSSMWLTVNGSDLVAVGDSVSYKNVMLIDLTLMYGAGNEPATVEEFTEEWPEAYYAYTTGTKMSRQPDGTWGAWIGNDYTVQFPATIYGGSWDIVNGVLTSTLASDGTELATPETYTVDKVDLSTILGYNSVYTDNGGTVTLTYRVDPTLAYEKLKNAIISLGGNV